MADPTLESALAFLRGHTTGELRFEDHLRPLRYVVDAQGRIVAPVMVAMLAAVETVLFVPECAEGAMELLLTFEQLEEHGADGALVDRWRIYHGEPEDVRWGVAMIDAARFDGQVLDGDGLMQPNPLAPDEPALCRMMNRERPEDLRRICHAFAGIDTEEPLMVGIDPMGIDVRRRFDVARVHAPRPMSSAEEARKVLEEMSGA